MKAYFHPSQDLHTPKTYFTRGQMRQPQEVADRTRQMLEGLKALGVEVLQPADQGAGPISDIHDLGYLRFLESAHQRWMEQDDWGEEVISNIFVRTPNHLQGILAEAARPGKTGQGFIKFGPIVQVDAFLVYCCHQFTVDFAGRFIEHQIELLQCRIIPPLSGQKFPLQKRCFIRLPQCAQRLQTLYVQRQAVVI